MKRTAFLMLPAVTTFLLAGTPVWQTEKPSQSLQLELKLSRRPPAVRPLPDPKVVDRDAEQAIADIHTRQRSEELVRETLQAPFRRPDLSYDVWSGIQSRNLGPALRLR
jgi:hypothetical protein